MSRCRLGAVVGAMLGLPSLLSTACGPSVTFVASDLDARGAAACARVGGDLVAGVPDEPVCPDAICTADVGCGTIVTVAPGDDLQAAASVAAPGDCVALAPGNHASVELPEGVSLLGRSAREVVVEQITTSGGDVVVRGVTVSGGGLTVHGGVVTVDRVAIRDGKLAGLAAQDGDVTLVDSCLADNASAGLYVTCSGNCGCPPVRSVRLERTLFRRNGNVAVWLDGSAASVEDVVIVDSQPIDFAGGHGIYATDCSSITGSRLSTRGNAATGVFLDHAGAALSPDVSIEGNRGGLLACAVPASLGLDLSGFTVTENAGFGFFLGAASASVRLADGIVRLTSLAPVATGLGEIAELGDGIDWTQGSELVVESTVEIRESARAPALIDGASNGSFSAVLAGGDEEIGVILQNGAAPEVAPGILKKHADPPWAVPQVCP